MSPYSPAEKLLAFFENTSLLVSLIIILCILGTYYFFLFKKYRLKAGRSLISSDELPHEISPASSRFIWKGHFDSDCLLSALVSAVVKGQYSAQWFPDGFKITFLPGSSIVPLSVDERKALTFSNGQFREIVSVSRNKSRFTEKAEDRMLEQLKKDHKRKFVERRKISGIGLGLGLLLILGSIASFMKPYFWLSAIYGIVLLPLALILTYVAIKAKEEKNWKALSISLFFLSFVLLGLWKFETSLPQFFFPQILPVFLINIAGYLALPPYTQKGWDQRASIISFRKC